MQQPFFNEPPKVTLSYTNSCNLDCRHCYADCAAEPAANELSTAEWIDLVDYLVRNDFIQVYIEGGEPLHRADFLTVLRHCASRLMTLVRTNGTLVTPSVARQFKEFGVGRVFVDLMGAAAETHDWFAGVPGSFAKACDAVRHLASAGVKTDVLVILTRRNAGEVGDLLHLAKSLGALRVGVLRLYPLGRSKRRWDELALSLEEQTEVIEGLRPPPGLGIMQSWHPKDRNCCWQAATVNAYGDSIGCTYLREYVNFGNVRATPLLETWHNDPLYKQLRSGQTDASCGGCHSHSGTHGGCRAAAYAFHRSWTAPDPFCSELNAGVDLRVLPEWLLQKSSKPPGAPDS